ncbi:MAG TPA: ATP-grasp domain-containing protein [Ktedonobacterales bacterium]|nr:ATP-grasp domain-containing protein [Ktedonobacterales bacterium]
MLLIYCADPLHPRQPDSAYAEEIATAEAVGLAYGLISYEALVDDNDTEAAVRRIPEQSPQAAAVYRGWMLRPEQYARLYNALAARGVLLINDPAAYRHCHYLPEWYPLFEGETPRSVWLHSGNEPSMDEIHQALQPFGARPVIVKDFVKSRKHEWESACYIPSAADGEAVARVVRRFLELQGDDLNEGLVFREFVPLEPLATHAKSGMPLTKEWRVFFLDGAPMLTAEYWETGDYGSVAPTLARFVKLAQRVRSRFFTMDIARQTNGDWTVIELGDGQVAGLPERADVLAFYQALQHGMDNAHHSASST